MNQMPGTTLQYVYAVWVVFFIVWLIASGRVKRTERQQSFPKQIPYILLNALGFWLLFIPQLRVGFLAARFVQYSPAIQYAGFAVTVAGAAFAFWARAIIGRNWSSTVTVKQDHELILRGPYQFVRHPIYTGMLTMILGTAIAIGEVRGLLALLSAFAGFRLKSLTEERFMTEQFGEQYTAYKRRVKALIPFIY